MNKIVQSAEIFKNNKTQISVSADELFLKWVVYSVSK